MKRFAITTIGFGFLFASSASADWSVNKDIINTSGVAGAAGIVVELCGPADVLDTYDGYSSGHFDDVEQGVSDEGNTTLKWSNLQDQDGNPGEGNGLIDQGQLVHVGWTLSANVCIKDMYYVDAEGNRIEGGDIENTTPLVESRPWGTDLTFASNSTDSIDIMNLRIVPIFPPEPGPVFALADLNMFNADLNAALVPYPPHNIRLWPGDTFRVALPPLHPGATLVLSATMTGPGSAATAIDFMQLTQTTPPNCPIPGCEQADLNGDCKVSLSDLSIVLAEFGLGGTDLSGDANGDGLVNLMDLSIVLGRFGINCGAD